VVATDAMPYGWAKNSQYHYWFISATLIKPKIYYTFGVQPLQMHLGGTPELHGYRRMSTRLSI